MALTIFLVLNAAGVIFLLYVLQGFWIEGHRRANHVHKIGDEAAQRAWVEVLVSTHPVSHSAHGGLPVIPFPMRELEFNARSAERAARMVAELPARRISRR